MIFTCINTNWCILTNWDATASVNTTSYRILHGVTKKPKQGKKIKFIERKINKSPTFKFI